MEHASALEWDNAGTVDSQAEQGVVALVEPLAHCHGQQKNKTSLTRNCRLVFTIHHHLDPDEPHCYHQEQKGCLPYEVVENMGL